MTTINNELELYTLKGNVTAGKILLFQSLEKEGNDKEQIEQLGKHYGKNKKQIKEMMK